MTTTAFFTHYWTSRQASALPRPLAALLVVLSLLLVVPARATEITSMRLEPAGDALLVSAQVRFELPPVIEDALQKGIPMFFLAEAVLLRDRWYWYDKEVATAARHMRLSFQPLTRRWRLLMSNAPIGNVSASLSQTFDSSDEALAAVQRISGLKLSDVGNFGEAEARYSVSLRFRLDVSQLPRPFQIGAVGQGEWNISATRTQRLAVEPAK